MTKGSLRETFLFAVLHIVALRGLQFLICRQIGQNCFNFRNIDFLFLFLYVRRLTFPLPQVAFFSYLHYSRSLSCLCGGLWMVLYLEHIDTISFSVEKEDNDFFSIGFSILTL